MTKNHAPASGEKNAITGYLAQYEFSATTILRRIQESQFDAISVCDHAAGILDDLVIFSGHDLLAYQVKSERQPKPFRLKTSLVDNGLITDIAKGWIALRQEYPDKKIHIRYIFSGYPSTNDKKVLDNVGHSADLFSYLTDPEIKMNKSVLLNSMWAPFIRDLIVTSTLDEDQFFEMFSLLKLYDHSEIIRRQIAPRDTYSFRKAQQIKHLLPELVANRGAKSIWSEQELIVKLGWAGFSRLRASHSFPIQHDVQVNSTVEENLEKVLNEHSSGYISLIGPPGTGKSTTLQRAITTTPSHGVARYLAFLPDQRHGLGRAEATDFLNDITFSLSKLGFSRPQFLDEGQLQEEFLKQLDEARQIYLEKGQKTLIIIDGLDHIEREESPRHNLLSILPPPRSIPEGVLFILGSQYLELEGLSPSIIKQASADGRCVEMSPLPRQAIFDMAEKSELPRYVDRQLLFNACKGHPLVARYYIEKLSAANDEEEANQLLSSDDVGSSIEEIYELVWGSLAPDEESKHVLALLARADNRISPLELASIVNEVFVERVLTQAGFLLSGRKEGKWSIFHNSFRVFLWRKTRKLFGLDNPDRDRVYFSELAQIAGNADRDSEQHWLELRYRSRAGDKPAVKNLATPKLFREHLRKFRPGSEIYVDLRLAYGAIENRSELPKLVQLMMIEKEIDYRLEAISQLDLVQIYLTFEEEDRAFETALADDRQTDGVFELLDRLYQQGDNVRARSLFEALEPAEYFFGHNARVLQHPEIEDICEWIKRAHRFRSIENILEIIEGLPFANHLQYDPSDRLRFVLAHGILNDTPTIDVDKLCVDVNLNDQAKTVLLIHAAIYLNNVGDHRSEIQELLSRLQDQVSELSAQQCRACVRIAFEQGDYDLARLFIANIHVRASNSFHDYNSGERAESLLSSTFFIARLSEHLGVEVQFEPSKTDTFQNTVLESLIRLGSLQGKLEKAENISSAYLKGEIKSICTSLAYAGLPEKSFSFDPIITSLKWFAKTLVKIAAIHGDATLRTLEEQVEQLLTRGDNRLSRSSPFRLTFSKAIYDIDGDQNKAIQRIRYLEGLIETEYTPQSAVELRIDLVTALAGVDVVDQAKTELSRIHNDTCGYWLAAKKEPQYVFWQEAYDRACRTAPNKAGDYAAHFAQFIIGLAGTEGSDTGSRITYGLLKNAAINPEQCAGIISRIVGTGLAGWADIVAATLHGIVLLRSDLAHQCFTVYCRLVTPFSGEYTFDAIEHIYQSLPDPVKYDAENDFIRCAQTFADAPYEAELLAELKKFSTGKNAILDNALARAECELSDLRGIETGKAGSSPSAEDRTREFKQIQSLSALVSASDGVEQHGKKRVDYWYARRALELAETAPLNELEVFLDERPVVLEDVKLVISVASRLWDLGATQKANEFYALAEKKVQKGSWSAWFGGEKIAFQKLRKKREGEKSQKKGFGAIVNDFTYGQASAQMVLPDLGEIFDLVAPEAAWDEVWLQIQDHISVYREFSITEPVKALPDVSSHEELIGYIFKTGFSLLSNVLTDRLRECLLKIAVQENGLRTFNIIAGQLVDDENYHREISAVLWKLIDESSCQETLIKYAKELSLSNDAVVTNIARNILYHFKVKFDVPSERLPIFYGLAVLGDENAKNFELPVGIEPGSKFWIDDPWYWTTVLGFEIDLISRASGIEIEAIRRRCAEFMLLAGGERAFGPSSEATLENNLRSLDLRFPYLRLMPHFAIKALGRVIEELTRADHIDLNVLKWVWSRLGGVHFANYELYAEPRPSWVIPAVPPKIDSWKISAEEWLQLGPDFSYGAVSGDWFVLAEQSEFSLSDGWKKRSVVRTSLPVSEWGCKPNENLFGMPAILDLDHLDIVLEEHKDTILCTIVDRMYGDLRDTILTLHHCFLDDFGWKRSKARPFDIYTNEDELVAKTLIWMDGIGLPSRSGSKERSGFGCALLISDFARGKIEEYYDILEISTRVIMRYDSNSEKKECIYFDGMLQGN